jgi:hypothetical protein
MRPHDAIGDNLVQSAIVQSTKHQSLYYLYARLHSDSIINPVQVQALVLSSVAIGKTTENTLDAAISAIATIIEWFSFATNVALVRTDRRK